MKRNKIALLVFIFVIGCTKFDHNITKPLSISASTDTLIANNLDIAKLDFTFIDQQRNKNQSVFLSTSIGKIYDSPVIDIGTEGADSLTLTPNQKKFSIYLKSGKSFQGNGTLITAIVNGYLVSTDSITFIPSCPNELIATINKDSLAINSNQDVIEGEIVAYCNSGSVSDDIRINYLLSDSSVIDINPKILKTSNETIEFTLIPKKMGTTQIEFYTDITGCDSIISNKISIKVY